MRAIKDLFEEVRIIDFEMRHAQDVIDLQDEAFPEDLLAFEKEDLSRAVSRTDISIYVAEINSKFAGYAVVKDRKWRPWTSGDFIAVNTEYRGSRAARELVIHGVKNARRPLFRIFVRPTNKVALNMYSKFGFKTFGRRKRNYPNDEDALIMMIRPKNLRTI